MTAIEIIVAGTMHVAFIEVLSRLRHHVRKARLAMSGPGGKEADIASLTAEEFAERLAALLG